MFHPPEIDLEKRALSALPQSLCNDANLLFKLCTETQINGNKQIKCILSSFCCIAFRAIKCFDKFQRFDGLGW